VSYRFDASSIQHPASSIQHPASSIQHPASSIQHPASSIQHPASAAGVWITRGAAHDPKPIAGATHLVEHLTLRACGPHDRRSLALAVDRLGGEVDAWTGSELMGVSVNTTIDAIGEALDLLVDAVLSPTFEPDDVELERRVTRAELELIADDPAERRHARDPRVNIAGYSQAPSLFACAARRNVGGGGRGRGAR
jgi:hypothetical protein